MTTNRLASLLVLVLAASACAGAPPSGSAVELAPGKAQVVRGGQVVKVAGASTIVMYQSGRPRAVVQWTRSTPGAVQLPDIDDGSGREVAVVVAQGLLLDQLTGDALRGFCLECGLDSQIRCCDQE